MAQTQEARAAVGIDPPERPTIAVVAVHGVGDHAPGESARYVMELLLRLRHDGRRVGAFVG
jgi:hypothetical protein